ncbi:MAG: hypothetical protein GEU78_18040 [Actinobacteria bacterium]|nr:hypothetical protein [Actinomycetota bacterium]
MAIGYTYGSEWHLLRYLAYHREDLSRDVEAAIPGSKVLRWLDHGYRKSLLVTDFVEGAGCPDASGIGPAILTVLKIPPGDHQRGGRHAIVRMHVPTPAGAQDDLHPLLAAGV